MKRMKVLILSLMLAMAVYGCSGEEEVRGDITNTVEADVSNESQTEEDAAEEEAALEEAVSEEAVIEEKVTEEAVSETDTAKKELSLGTNDGVAYESEFIGLGYRLNDGWSFYTDEQIKELNSATADMAGEEYQELISEAELIYDMFAADADGLNNINVNLEKMNSVQLIALDIKQNFEAAMPIVKDAYENMGYTNFAYEISTAEIAGKEMDVAYTTAEINGVNLYQTLFAVKCNGYLANITVSTCFDNTTSQVIDNIYWLE